MHNVNNHWAHRLWRCGGTNERVGAQGDEEASRKRQTKLSGPGSIDSNEMGPFDHNHKIISMSPNIGVELMKLERTRLMEECPSRGVGHE